MAEHCLQNALRLLGRRDHATAELRRKLAQRGYAESQIAPVLAECRRLNYLDDRRFADLFADRQRRKGYGVVRISQMLRDKGLDSDNIEDCIRRNCDEENQLADCRQVLDRAIRKSANCSRERLFRFLLSRGFTSSVIHQTLAAKNAGLAGIDKDES